MPSKYDKVFPRLKKLPVEDMDYQQKANVVKEQILAAQPVESPATNDVETHAKIEVILEEIAELIKELCETVIAGHAGRRYASVYARYWRHLRNIEDYLDNQLKIVRLLLYAEEQLGLEQFEVEGTDKIGLDDLGSVYSQPEIVIKVVDRDKFRTWCIEQGLLRELNLHHGTATSLTKTRLVNGEEEPPGVEAYHSKKFTK